MDIRILHHDESGFGWSLDSPGISALIGGTDHYDSADAERAGFALESEAEETGRPAPESVRFEPFVPADAAAAWGSLAIGWRRGAILAAG